VPDKYHSKPSRRPQYTASVRRYQAFFVNREKERIEFKDKYGISLPILIDENGKEAKAYGVRGYHKTFFINRKGKIVGYTFAEKDWTSKKVKNLIKFLLNERE
jgi:peroxiredoxin